MKLDWQQGWLCPRGNGTHVVESSDKTKKYTVVICMTELDPHSCTCPAYSFSKTDPKTCKHIDNVIETKVCGWASVFSSGIPVKKNGAYCCPLCDTGLVITSFLV